MDLLTAIRGGDVEKVRKLVTEGVHLKQVNLNETPLQAACEANQLEIIKILVASKADLVNEKPKYGHPALLVAIRYIKEDIVQYLLEHQADPNLLDTSAGYIGWTPLIHASSCNKLDLVELLIRYKADVNIAIPDGETALTIAAKFGHVDIVRCLLQNGANIDHGDSLGLTPLIMACKRKRIECVRVLLEHNATVDKQCHDGGTALMSTCSSGLVDLTKLLLDSHAGVDISDRNGTTALIIAAGLNQLGVMDLLLIAGANINQQDKAGADALMHACERGHAGMVEWLCKHGANTNQRNSAGETALILATVGKFPNCIEILLHHEADPEVEDDEDNNALDIARHTRNLFTIKLLTDHLDKYSFYMNIKDNKLGSPCPLFLAPVLCQANTNTLQLLTQLCHNIIGWKSEGDTNRKYAAYKVTADNDVIVLFTKESHIDVIMMEVYTLSEAGIRQIEDGLLCSIRESLQNAVSDHYLFCFIPCAHTHVKLKAECRIGLGEVVLNDSRNTMQRFRTALCPHGCTLADSVICKWFQDPGALAANELTLDKYLRATSRYITDEDKLTDVGLALDVPCREINRIRCDHPKSIVAAGLQLLLLWKQKKQVTDVEVAKTKLQTFVTCRIEVDKYLRAVSKCIINEDQLYDVGLELGIPAKEIHCIRTERQNKIGLASWEMLILWKDRNLVTQVQQAREKLRDAFVNSNLGNAFEGFLNFCQ